MALEGKYIGLILAICSSLLIGTSFVITKKGLLTSSTKEHGNYKYLGVLSSSPIKKLPPKKIGHATDSHRYLKNPVWWVGLIVMVMGEVMNFIGKSNIF